MRFFASLRMTGFGVTSVFLLIGILCIPRWVYPEQRNNQKCNKELASGRITFSSYMSGNWDIWAVNPDGSGFMQITHTDQEKYYPAWSLDGTKIAYANNEGEICVMEIGKRPQKIPNLPENCNYPSWSPDGSKIAFVCYFFVDRMEDSDIWIADVRKGKVFKFIDQEGIQSYPAWSPDGLMIAYTTGYRISSDKIIEELWVVDSDGKYPRPLISDNFSNIQPDWSPDGQKIAFASNKNGNMDIWVMDKEGRNMRPLTYDKSYDADPNWSPDGSKICFTSTRNGKLDIWVMDSDGQNQRQLTGLSDSKAESKEPDWSR